MMIRAMIAALAALVPATLAAQAAQTVDYAIAAPAAGAWTYRPGAGTSHALFTGVTASSRVSVSCNRQVRRVSISRTGVTAPVNALSVWTSSLQRSVAARHDLAAMSVIAELAAFDGLLDAMAFSRGRFVIGTQGLAPLVVPGSPEVARVIEDCRI